MKLSEVMAARQMGEYTDEHGVTWKLQRTSMERSAEIRAIATPPKALNSKTGKFEDQEPDVALFKALKVAISVVEPEIDGATPQEKAATIRKHLTEIEVQRLFEMSLMLDDLDLSRKVEDAAKN